MMTPQTKLGALTLGNTMQAEIRRINGKIVSLRGLRAALVREDMGAMHVALRQLTLLKANAIREKKLE